MVDKPNSFAHAAFHAVAGDSDAKFFAYNKAAARCAATVGNCLKGEASIIPFSAITARALEVSWLAEAVGALHSMREVMPGGTMSLPGIRA